ncbi:MAG: hypothetical protein PHH60_04855 [Candidatus Margulisbacteria bacterium]|nr:hypothetical protein [Candidatus Margulisiibacteriota bacterium]
MKKICLMIVSWLLVITIGGCARNVTPIVSAGDQIVVEVTLRGNIDVSANRYFLVLSADPNYKIPLPPPYQLDDAPELIEPGTTPLIGSAEAYYTNFYSTWSGYVLADPIGYTLVKGPFTIGQSPTREVLSTLGNISTKVSFSFRLGRLFATVPDQIYFDIIALPWANGLAKIPADHLPTSSNYILKYSGSYVVVDDTEDSSLDPSIDILKCRVDIQ